jgi:hypothetical protein
VIIDCTNWTNLSSAEMGAGRCRVFVDDRELRQVWYVDTDLNFVRTYDVLGNGRIGTGLMLARDLDMLTFTGLVNDPNVSITPEGPAYRTIHVRIRLEPLEAAC